jgi:hypothetical protein
MKPMKVDTCPTCGWKTIRRATCRDCASMLVSIDLPFRLSCRFGLTGKRLCWRFQKRPGVEILKERKGGEE